MQQLKQEQAAALAQKGGDSKTDQPGRKRRRIGPHGTPFTNKPKAEVPTLETEKLIEPERWFEDDDDGDAAADGSRDNGPGSQLVKGKGQRVALVSSSFAGLVLSALPWFADFVDWVLIWWQCSLHRCYRCHCEILFLRSATPGRYTRTHIHTVKYCSCVAGWSGVCAYIHDAHQHMLTCSCVNCVLFLSTDAV